MKKLSLKSATRSSLFMPFILISGVLTLIILAFYAKNDETKKFVGKLSEYVPADIVPAAKV